MAQHTLIGNLDIGDLCDQLRLDPVRPANGGARRLDRRRLAFERRHDLHQALDLVAAEAGADLAGITQLAMLVHSQQQRAESALLARWGPADDHELLSPNTLGLHPAPAA